ncbi:MAG: dissimilatory-type sulfite reductase subunit alpha [Spirochaetota bacterium]|nr:dissimilatory-type sulfite reductase subunit alpha [Spirochaetota bacterium]
MADKNQNNKSKFLNPTPVIDNLEIGPWPSFITGFKELAERTKKPMIRGVMDQLEYSYNTKTGYWKGGLVGVLGYGSGVISRYSMIPDKFPEAAEFHTLRVMPAPGLHYNTKVLRKVCDIWEKYGSGIMVLHGQSGDLLLQGITEENVQECFDELNKEGWDLGGAGAAVRTAASCVGPARCEQACYDNIELHHQVIKHFAGMIHRPELLYKFKFKFSACPNDCVNSIMRADFSIIGTWKDSIQIDHEAVARWIDKNGIDTVVNQVISMCPTRSITLDNKNLNIDNSSCVRCMHCLNVMTEALSPGKERGVTLLLGGKSHLKVGSMFGSLIVPFMKMENDDDIKNFIELSEKIIDWWTDNGFDHERIGETIERVGLKQFLDGVGLEATADMVSHPRDNPFYKAEY